MHITKRQAPNGVRLLMEPIHEIRSASIGLILEVGSRHELPAQGGICHFIEHMFFKGTARRDVFALADEMNRLGGHFNAFTSQESLCLHARVIDARAVEGMELLAEMLTAPTFPEEEIARERDVILEEYKMIEDTPEDLVIDLFHQAIWGEGDLGRPVIGAPETIAAFDRPAVVNFTAREFTGGRLIVAASGAFDKEEMAKRVESMFAGVNGGAPAAASNAAANGAMRRIIREKDIEQTQVAVGVPSSSRVDEDRFAFALLSTVLGGGMSSRFFKEVREKRGLAYSIGAYGAAFRDAGCFGAAFGASSENVPEIIEICAREIRDACAGGVKADELNLAKEQMKTSMLLSLESANSRMMRMVDQETYFGRQISIDELLKRVDAVTPADIQEVAERRFMGRPVAVAAVGPIAPDAIAIESF